VADPGRNLKQQSRYGLDSEHVDEITMWLVIPYASRHNLAISEELGSFLADANMSLDMEEDHSNARLFAGISATPQCRTACSFVRKFVNRFLMHELMDECKLDWGQFYGFLQFLEMTEGKQSSVAKLGGLLWANQSDCMGVSCPNRCSKSQR
jgi:hypothetical protein